MRFQRRYSCDVIVSPSEEAVSVGTGSVGEGQLLRIDVAADDVTHAAKVAKDAVISETIGDSNLIVIDVVGVKRRNKVYQDW